MVRRNPIRGAVVDDDEAVTDNQQAAEVDLGQGAVGGLVGDAGVSQPPQENGPEMIRDQLGPFIREVIREEMRGSLDLHPAPVMEDLGDDFPLGRGAVPRRPRNNPGFGEAVTPGSHGAAQPVPGPSRGGSSNSLPPPHLTPVQLFDGVARQPDQVRQGLQNLGPALREDLHVKVRAFDPKEQDWFSYRTHFIGLAQQAAWSDRTRTTKLMGALQGSLAGVTAGLPQPVTFDSLIARVDGIYGLANAREDAVLKLQSCRLDSGEGVSLFAERVRQLVIRAYPTYTDIDREEQALRVFLQGLPTRNDMRMQMRVKGFASLREAVEYGSRLEQILKDERQQENKKPPHIRGATEEQSDVLKSVAKLTQEFAKIQQSQSKQLEAFQKLQDQGMGRGLGNFGPTGQRGPANGRGYGPPRNQNPNGGQQERCQGDRNPSNSPCVLCGEYGHWVKDCPAVKGNDSPGSQRPNGGPQGRQGPLN